jgi:hypothetical protein
MPFKPKEPDNDAGQRARQQYLELSRRIIGEPKLDYLTLYGRFATNDWAAIKLDDAIARSALKSGCTPKETVAILHQSPYLQHQVHQNKVPLAPMSQYVRSTVLKVMQQLEKSQVFEQQLQQRSRQRQSGMELE